MGDRRFLLAMGLSFAAFVAYLLLVEPLLFPRHKRPPAAPQAAPQTAASSAPAPGNPAAPQSPSAPAKPGDTLRAAPSKVSVTPIPGGAQVRQVPLKSDGRWEAVFSSEGGTLRQWTVLPREKDRLLRSPARVIEETGMHPATGSLSLILPGGETIDLSRQAWESDPGHPDEPRYRLKLDNGLLIEKAFEPVPDADEIRLKLRISNGSGQPLPVRYRLLGAHGLVEKEEKRDGAYPLIGSAVFLRKEPIPLIRTEGASGLKKETKEYGDRPLEWGVLANKYFFVAFQPVSAKPEESPVARVSFHTDETGPDRPYDIGFSVETDEQALAPGAEIAHEYRLAVAPKSSAWVQDDPHLSLAWESQMKYGNWVPGIVACQKLMLWILKLCQGVVVNYGLAILLLTFLIRLALHPLTYRMQASMATAQQKMAKMQPKIQEIQKKHKNDKKKQNEEMMKLFQEHGNPYGSMMAGCLPMFLQMPILIGLYQAIANAIELRQAPFFLWIGDLSRPDRLFTLPFGVPMLGDTRLGMTDINVLPVIMTCLSFFQMRLQPQAPSVDPDQAKQQKFMQYFMLVFFGWIFYSLASGLVLYWTASQGLGIIEQRYIKRKLARKNASQ